MEQITNYLHNDPDRPVKGFPSGRQPPRRRRALGRAGLWGRNAIPTTLRVRSQISSISAPSGAFLGGGAPARSDGCHKDLNRAAAGRSLAAFPEAKPDKRDRPSGGRSGEAAKRRVGRPGWRSPGEGGRGCAGSLACKGCPWPFHRWRAGAGAGTMPAVGGILRFSWLKPLYRVEERPEGFLERWLNPFSEFDLRVGETGEDSAKLTVSSSR